MLGRPRPGALGGRDRPLRLERPAALGACQQRCTEPPVSEPGDGSALRLLPRHAHDKESAHRAVRYADFVQPPPVPGVPPPTRCSATGARARRTTAHAPAQLGSPPYRASTAPRALVHFDQTPSGFACASHPSAAPWGPSREADPWRNRRTAGTTTPLRQGADRRCRATLLEHGRSPARWCLRPRPRGGTRPTARQRRDR